MNETEQETPFSEKTINFRPRIVYTFFDPFNCPRRLLKGWHLFPFHESSRVEARTTPTAEDVVR